jgi:hypothetical protein
MMRDQYIILVVALADDEPFKSITGGRWNWQVLIEEVPPRPFPL